MGRLGGKKNKGGAHGGWQNRMGRLLREDAEKKKEDVLKKEASKAPLKRKRGDVEAEEKDGEESAFAKTQDDDPEGAAKRRKEMYRAEDKGKQLFVGNLPFDATVEEITERFAVYGKVHRVMLVKDRESGQPTGVGFVHFKGDTAVEKAIAESETRHELNAIEKGTKEAKALTRKQQKRQIFKGKTGNPDDEKGLLFNGRLLSVKPAVSKKAATGMTRQAEREKEKDAQADPRNLALLEEGRVLPNSPAAVGLSENRVALLNQRFQNKKKRLKDPNYFVSPSRLCIRDLPPDVDEKGLKKVVSTSIRGFTKSKPDFTLSDDDKRKSNPFIKQLSLSKDAANRSRGFGFVQFRHDAVALHVLRDLNNNPTLFGGKRLDVEFAVESVHALQRLERITNKGRERNRTVSTWRKEGVEDAAGEWRAQQQEKADAKLREKEKRKKEFEKYKKYQRFSGRKN
eukprot:TRINITY_DN25022_c0_g1_i1.p1 TRINITY_DN25022_c0_g1~~TRINITY_DN25022_c0_g1_i1.p1  ORF type:complete len:456 (+),score=202.68 TRINITY_DN25022_c0_g1_i1:66-1433(+)